MSKKHKLRDNLRSTKKHSVYAQADIQWFTSMLRLMLDSCKITDAHHTASSKAHVYQDFCSTSVTSPQRCGAPGMLKFPRSLHNMVVGRVG